MEPRTIISIVCVLALVFMLYVTFSAQRGCEVIDGNMIKTVNCLEVGKYENN